MQTMVTQTGSSGLASNLFGAPINEKYYDLFFNRYGNIVVGYISLPSGAINAFDTKNKSMLTVLGRTAKITNSASVNATIGMAAYDARDIYSKSTGQPFFLFGSGGMSFYSGSAVYYSDVNYLKLATRNTLNYVDSTTGSLASPAIPFYNSGTINSKFPQYGQSINQQYHYIAGSLLPTPLPLASRLCANC